MSEGIRIARLTGDRADETASALAMAFHDDPLFMDLWPSERHRARTLRNLFIAQTKTTSELDSGYIATKAETGEVLGASMWVEPGIKRNLRQTVREIRSVWPTLLWPQTLVSGTRLLMAIDRLRPDSDHWYLEALGVAPQAQGLGAGRGLVEVGLQAADRAGVPVYLETSKEENLGYYHRFGFEIQQTVQPGGRGPIAWTMLREPREVEAYVNL